MAINLSSGGLRHRASESEDVNPMAGLVNLADCMLVFACGLMLSLVTYWNIDIGPTATEVLQGSEMTEVSDVETITDEYASGGTAYTEMGTVYQDPTTGTLYMLTEEAPATDE